MQSPSQQRVGHESPSVWQIPRSRIRSLKFSFICSSPLPRLAHHLTSVWTNPRGLRRRWRESVSTPGAHSLRKEAHQKRTQREGQTANYKWWWALRKKGTGNYIGSGEMAPWFRAHIALAGSQVRFPAPTWCSQPSKAQVPGDPIPSFDFCRYQAWTRCTYIHSGKILIHMSLSKINIFWEREREGENI